MYRVATCGNLVAASHGNTTHELTGLTAAGRGGRGAASVGCYLLDICLWERLVALLHQLEEVSRHELKDHVQRVVLSNDFLELDDVGVVVELFQALRVPCGTVPCCDEPCIVCARG
jgi:hypothetical protein